MHLASSHTNRVSTTHTYDTLNWLSTVVDNRLTGSNATTTYGYDTANNLTSANYPNNVQSVITYDPLNRITGLATQNSGYLYQRGPTGNLIQGTELSGRSATWNFDGIYRLTGESVSNDPANKNGSVSYNLDPVGNRSSETSSLAGLDPGSFTYNTDDELSGETYDSDGNTTGSGGKSFVYDSQNHMISMTNGSTTATFVYDGDGNRVAKTVGAVTTQYLVDDLNPTGYPQVVEAARFNFSTRNSRKTGGRACASNPV